MSTFFLKLFAKTKLLIVSAPVVQRVSTAIQGIWHKRLFIKSLNINGNRQRRPQAGFHPQTYINDFQENIWKEEIQIFEFEELLGTKRKEKAALDLELDQKGKPPANEEKKALAKLETEIESIQKALEQKQADKGFWEKRIELIKRYQESHPHLESVPEQFDGMPDKPQAPQDEQGYQDSLNNEELH